MEIGTIKKHDMYSSCLIENLKFANELELLEFARPSSDTDESTLSGMR